MGKAIGGEYLPLGPTVYGRLRLGIGPAGVSVAVLGSDRPEAIVRLDGAVGVKDFEHDVGATPGSDASEVGPDGTAGCSSLEGG